jgi:hypothetical protein
MVWCQSNFRMDGDEWGGQNKLKIIENKFGLLKYNDYI